MPVDQVTMEVVLNPAAVNALLNSRAVGQHLQQIGAIITAHAIPHSGEEYGDLKASMSWRALRTVGNKTRYGAGQRDEEGGALGGRFAGNDAPGRLAHGEWHLVLGSFGRPQHARPDNPDQHEVPYAVYNWAGWTDRGGTFHPGTHPWSKAAAELGIRAVPVTGTVI